MFTVNNIKAHILLVEDDPDLSEILVESLAIYGISVMAVASGRDFHCALNQGTYAAALIDLGLPDLDGNELISYLRQNTDMKIIVMTARASTADRVRGYASGADLYLIKPVVIEELVAALLSIISRRTAHTALPEGPVNWRLHRATMQVTGPGGYHFPLSPREFRLLSLLAAANGNEVRREEALSAVYNVKDDSKSRALDVLVSRLRSRYLATTGEQFQLVTIPGFGFRFAALLTAI